MKRWLVTVQQNEQIKKIGLYYPTKEELKSKWKDLEILDMQEDTNLTYQPIIENIQKQSSRVQEKQNAPPIAREYYLKTLTDGTLVFQLWKDTTDNIYYDSVQYKFQSRDSPIITNLWTIISIEEFYVKFFDGDLSCEIPIYRFYGEPKLSKPKELKGVKQSFTTEWIYKKCTCPCFVKDNDLWIHHKDFFSQSHKPTDLIDYTMPLDYRLKKYFGQDNPTLKHFVYSDCWGDVVLRNEAWIVFRNFKQVIDRDKHTIVSALKDVFLASDTMQKRSYVRTLSRDWDLFFERLIMNYKQYTKERVV